MITVAVLIHDIANYSLFFKDYNFIALCDYCASYVCIARCLLVVCYFVIKTYPFNSDQASINTTIVLMSLIKWTYIIYIGMMKYVHLPLQYKPV